MADLDPDLARLAKAIENQPPPPLTSLTPAQARHRVREGNRLCAAGPELADVRDTVVGYAGRTAPVRMYRPSGDASGRMLVYAHGGGWVTGDLDYADELCRWVARDAQCTVVSVDYRLAPEHPHPAGLDDVETVVRWAGREAETLALAGDSSGGNLAAACALRLRDTDGPGLAFVALLYPVLDHDFGRPSYRRPGGTFPMGRPEMEWFFDHYVPDASQRDDPSISPLRGDLRGLPPTLVVIAGHDALYDEAAAYAALLGEARVPVVLRDHPELCHGFLRFTAVSSGAAAARDAVVADVVALFRGGAHKPTVFPDVNNHAYDLVRRQVTLASDDPRGK